MSSCSFTGHRCDLLYGWNIDIKEYKILAQIIAKHCRELIKKKNVSKFYTGGALGFDTVAFWTINYLKKEFPNIKNVLCIPFEGYNKNWYNKADIERFHRMLSVADEIIYVNKMPGYETVIVDSENVTKEEANVMLERRNHFMID
ncbi:SLOG family protein [Clostridium perfringens]